MLRENSTAIMILIVENDDNHAELIMRSFEDSPDEYTLKHVRSLSAAREVIESCIPGLVLTDYRLPDGYGSELLGTSNTLFPVIFMTSHGNEHVAVEAIKAGALDYIVKSPETFSSLARIANRGLREWNFVQERNTITEAVSRGKREWEQTFDAVPDLIAIIDNARTITRVNRAMAERCGLTPEEIIGRPCHEVMHGRAVPPVFCQHGLMMQDGVQHRYEVDEQYLNATFDVTVTPLRGDAGQITACVHVARDITERKKKDDALRSSKQRLKTILDASTAGVISTQLDGTITFFNNRISDMFGYSSEELLAMNYDALVHPDQRTVGVDCLHDLISGQIASITSERHYLRKDGSSFWGYISARSVLDADGKSPDMLATITDISDIKETRQALLKSSELLRLAMEASTDGIWDWDLVSGAVHWSPRCFTMLGYEPDEFVLTYGLWKELLLPDHAEEALRSIREQLYTGEGHFTVEYRIAVKGGGWRWIQTRGKPVARDQQGNILRIVGTHTDIENSKREESERQSFEQKLQQTQKLESLGVLAGGIAHDFNNILTIILGHCYISSEEIDSGMTPKSHLLQIETAANRAADLCRQMLAYAGKSTLVQTQVNLRLLVEDIVKMLKSAIKKNVVVELYLKRDVPEITGDVSQIQQIVMNLIINAAEAIGDNNGTIRVMLEAVKVPTGSSEADFLGNPVNAGSYALLKVCDNGGGMDPETQQRIFEPFYTTKFTGRGLGMSAVLGIIKSHDGAISISSQPGIGTTFKVYFPLTSPVGAAEELPLTVPAPLIDSGVTVLLVDDEEALRKIGSALLDAMGFTAITASNGREALGAYLAGESGISLAILDLNMPEMGGVETYHELRKISPTIPVIMVSGYDIELSQWGIEGDPLVSALKKPYKPEQLRNALITLLDKAR